VIRNPVIPGFAPDPSIVRSGTTYYLATSTFEWIPGIQIHASTDLASWRLVGGALTGGQHIDLRGVAGSCGVWAPSLSRHPVERRFYLTYSVVWSVQGRLFDVENFVVTAETPEGPWSAPRYLNSVGFDPSLFHDDDGRSWLVALEWDPRKGYEHPGPVVLDEYDRERETLVGPTRRIYRGGTDRGCLEGPQLYRHGGRYYLVAAEGGTGYGHCVTVARSDHVDGPYEPDPSNPILTSAPTPYAGRGEQDPCRVHLFNPAVRLQKAGHGSLVETEDGQWYLAHLCARPVGPGHSSILGRETAIQRVTWTEEGWLRLADGGRLPRDEVPAPHGVSLPEPRVAPEVLVERFERPRLGPHLLTPREPATDDWASTSARPGHLRLRGRSSLFSRFSVSLVATRLPSVYAECAVTLEHHPEHYSQSAGLVAYYDDENFVFLRSYLSESLGSRALGVMTAQRATKDELLEVRTPVADGPIRLRMVVEETRLYLSWAWPGGRWVALDSAVDIAHLSDEAAGGFTGTMVGMAAQDGYRRTSYADFSDFTLVSRSVPAHGQIPPG